MPTNQIEVCDSLVTERAGEDLPAAGLISKEEREQMIATAAYRRYAQRAGAPGDPLQDWLEAEKEVDATLSTRAAPGAHAKKVLVSWLSTVLEECHAQIEDLGTKAKAANAAMKRKYAAQLTSVTPKYDTARSKFLELCAEGDDAWAHLREGAVKATNEMRTAVRQAVSVFK